MGEQATFDYLSTKNSGALVTSDARNRLAVKKGNDKNEVAKNFKPLHRGSKQFGKQSVDYDDTEFLQKMFSNVDSDIRNLSKNNGGHQNSVMSMNKEAGQALESFRKNQNDIIN